MHVGEQQTGLTAKLTELAVSQGSHAAACSEGHALPGTVHAAQRTPLPEAWQKPACCKKNKRSPYDFMAVGNGAAQYFQGGDAWWLPFIKVAVDQTLWAAAWNASYLLALGVLPA